MPTYKDGDRFYQDIERNAEFSGIYYRITGRTEKVANTWVSNSVFDKSNGELLYKYIDDRYPDKELTIREDGINKMISSGMWREKVKTEFHNTSRLEDVDF